MLPGPRGVLVGTRPGGPSTGSLTDVGLPMSGPDPWRPKGCWKYSVDPRGSHTGCLEAVITGGQ